MRACLSSLIRRRFFDGIPTNENCKLWRPHTPKAFIPAVRRVGEQLESFMLVSREQSHRRHYQRGNACASEHTEHEHTEADGGAHRTDRQQFEPPPNTSLDSLQRPPRKYGSPATVPRRGFAHVAIPMTRVDGREARAEPVARDSNRSLERVEPVSVCAANSCREKIWRGQRLARCFLPTRAN